MKDFTSFNDLSHNFQTISSNQDLVNKISTNNKNSKIIQNEKGTSRPTGKSKGPQLKKMEQSSPSGSRKNAVSSNKPSNESKWGFNSDPRSVPGFSV